MIDTGLGGRVVLVTGANHGIGAAIACAFACEGANVFIAYLRQSPDLYGASQGNVEKASTPGRDFYCREIGKSADDVLDWIRALGRECVAAECDLSDPANIPRLFDEAEERWGAVDVLVNNAAFDVPDTFLPQRRGEKEAAFAEEYPLKTLTAETHDAHFEVNSRAVALMMSEYAKRYMARHAQSGRIVNITTDGARCHESNVSYAASKHAIESYTRSAAVELGPYGITVNAISPGAVQTGWMPVALEQEIASQYPLRRIGQPEDIARAVIFFASDQAAWITGQILQVGGGHLM